MSISNPDATPFDPAVIAQLANELFAAWPGRPIPPAEAGIASAPPATSPVEVGALPVAPAVPPSSAVGPLTEAEFRSLPSTASGATPRPPQAGFTPSAALGPYEFRPELAPDEGAMTRPAASVAAPSASPPVETGTASAISATGLASPSEAELRALPATLTAPATPAAPGSSFYFLDAAQSPSPPALPAPSLGDYEFHPNMLPDLAITAGPYDPRMDRRNFPG